MKRCRSMRLRGLLLAAGLALLSACGGGGGAGGGATSPPVTPAPTAPASLFDIVSDAQWDDTAVRQVLHTFAFGGHASDAQVRAWADMSPRAAIDEMLVLTPTHAKLSPPQADDDIGSHNASLQALAAHFASDAPRNRIAPPFREFFRLDTRVQGIAPDLTWSFGSVLRGVNPVRMRLGFFETNYHLAVHQTLGNVNDAQMVRYFDDIVGGLARGDSYDLVLANASVSAAIATQYGHHRNVYLNGQFSGNEDFAREFHQLFFGIFGSADPAEHETVTIKNTARALSGIRLSFDANGFLTAVPAYSAELHDPNDLRILGASISGATAPEKIRRLAAVAIEHPESEDNLPVILVAGLADDALDAGRIASLRRGWRAMERKDLLRFLRDYAISPLFHDPRRVKRLNSFERHLLAVNLMLLDNAEAFTDLYDTRRFTEEGAEPFKPANNVFGGQRGTDAAASAAVFRSALNRSVEQWQRFAIPAYEQPLVGAKEKDWGSVAPRDADGRHRAGTVARWLWQRFVADGLSRYGPLEQAQLLSLLVAGTDFASIATNGSQPDRVYTASEIEGTPALQALLADLANREVALTSTDRDQRRIANALVGQGVNFIVATPWFFTRQGVGPSTGAAR